MFLLKLAFKNLTRHKRRTLLTSSALAVGLVMYILLDSLLVGMFSESNRNLKDAETADGKILTVETFKDIKFLPLNSRIEEPNSIIKLVESYGGKASPRVLINGDMIFTDEYFPVSGSLPILLTCIDMEKDNNAFNVLKERNLVEGRFMTPGLDEVVIGSWLAEDIGAEIGDWITIAVKTASNGDDPGFYQTIDVEIVGFLKVENPMINRRVVYLSLDMADFYLDLFNTVSEIGIRIPRGYTLETFKKAINDNLPVGTFFYTWKEVAADYVKLLEAETGGSTVILFLIVLIALVGITNTMLMTINERQMELGMMRALGMTTKDIRIAFLFEAAGIGIIGVIMGLLLGFIINIPIVSIGIDFSLWMRNMDMGYKISSIMRGAWHWQAFIIACVFGILVPVIVALFPTRKAIRKSITDCLYR
ncbi:MAG: ABC transporter permease [Spirochaetales bacterium]|nr:ABC transporter permease [Spirochaetales bacterium]